MILDRKPRATPMLFGVAAAIAAAALAGCGSTPSKDALEAARNTFACQLGGERIVIRFDADEARILMPGGDRVVLYQIPSGSGVRYSNGVMELRGKGTELQLIRDGTLAPLDGCQPYAPPT
jgi:membrane-bound inhibitor of C-type lysozyme